MRFAVSAAALLAFASSALAQTANFDPISKPTKDETIPAGSTFDITWQADAATYPDKVTIELLGGSSPSTLQILKTIASGVDNTAGHYSWAVGSDLGTDATYGIKISYDDNSKVFQYSFPFHIQAAKNGKTTTTTSTHTRTSTITVSSGAVSTSTTVVNTTMVKTPCTTSSAPTVTSANGTTTSSPSTMATVTSTAVVTTSSPTTTGVATTTAPASGAAQIATGSFALVGGLAMVLLAL